MPRTYKGFEHPTHTQWFSGQKIRLGTSHLHTDFDVTHNVYTTPGKFQRNTQGRHSFNTHGRFNAKQEGDLNATHKEDSMATHKRDFEQNKQGPTHEKCLFPNRSHQWKERAHLTFVFLVHSIGQNRLPPPSLQPPPPPPHPREK